MSIYSLGLAENYAILGNRYLYMRDAGDVKGFMGSNFLSYPDPNLSPPLDSNGIQLIGGTIPNAPIVNGAAAKQAIDDVNKAITQYQGVTPVNNITGPVNLSAIIAGPGLYNINGNLTDNTNVTLTGTATNIYVFNVTGNITIQNSINPGDILPQNIIFIATGNINIDSNANTYGIYISTGISVVLINCPKLTGRIISTTNTVLFRNSTITAP